MRLDANLQFDRLLEVPALAREAEALGFNGIWTHETRHDPFLPLALAAEHTRQITLGTGVAIAFARSPTVIAYTAWDLAAAAPGRVILGLGTQVKAHIERRFGMPWDPPVPKLRETIEAIRAVWACWQLGNRLNYRGRFFKLTLMSPFFDPGPIPDPCIPIVLAGVNPPLARLAGEVGDGFFVHPFHTPRYLREVLLPAIEAGARKAGRSRKDLTIVGSVFVITGRNETEMREMREFVRAQVAFYGSTPSYRRVWSLHGWEAIGEELSALAARGRWEEMPSRISEDILETFAITAPPEAVWERLQAVYEGLLDRVILYRPFQLQDRDLWERILSARC
ncbi:TIGR03617 family F420-dependent LLM class oxidoreductase [Thermoflexus sp.]|uniref:TIGR03617 family F420-dependent LLM class oxidoreductase n=1 Tax=Thermoflexus sp. TaxID=1969742 RepID=UPI0035E42F6C